MSRLRYFAYGSNLDAEQMRERCPGSDPLFAARLDDHRLDFTLFSSRWQGGAADVVREAGAVVWGVVYRLEIHDLDRLDGFERSYDRLSLEVEDRAGAVHETISYTVTAKQPTHTPHEAYLEKMLRWGERWGFPDDYLASLRTFHPARPAEWTSSTRAPRTPR